MSERTRFFSPICHIMQSGHMSHEKVYYYDYYDYYYDDDDDDDYYYYYYYLLTKLTGGGLSRYDRMAWEFQFSNILSRLHRMYRPLGTQVHHWSVLLCW